MSWEKMVYFFDKNLETTVENKDYLEEIKIDYARQESFGNVCVKVLYLVEFNERSRNLPSSSKIKLAETFAETSFCIYTLHPAGSRVHNDSLKLHAFKNIYLSITSFLILRLERELGQNFPIKVKAISNWPEVNYAEKYINDMIQKSRGFYGINDSDYNQDVHQYERLMSLAVNDSLSSRERREFKLSDEHLINISGLLYYQVRWIIVNNNTPILIDGYATINKIWIRPYDFIMATRNEFKEKESLSNHSIFSDYFSELEYLIVSVYDDFLQIEKEDLITSQKEQFIRELNLEEGDILELHDNRIVSLSLASFDKDSELVIDYSLIKTNLELSQRGGKIIATDISYYLKSETFFEYKNQNVVLRKSPFTNWMKKRKVKFDYTPFVPDLIGGIL